MTRPSLRSASVVCLVLWAALWVLFTVLRFSSLDIRRLPGAGPVMLGALAVVFVAPFVATVLAGVASLRQPRRVANWLILACAAAILVCQMMVFMVAAWM